MSKFVTHLLTIFSLYGFFVNPAIAADLTMSEGWVRAMPPNMTRTAAYMHIDNASEKDIALLSATCDAFNKVEIHQTVIENDFAKMEPIEKLVIPAQGSVILKPKSFHIMLLERQRPLKEGDTVDITLSFDNDTSQTLTLPVKRGESQMMHHH